MNLLDLRAYTPEQIGQISERAKRLLQVSNYFNDKPWGVDLIFYLWKVSLAQNPESQTFFPEGVLSRVNDLLLGKASDESYSLMSGESNFPTHRGPFRKSGLIGALSS